MKNFAQKGPLVKMMRWFSWFESAKWYRPELHTLKMFLEWFLSIGISFGGQ